MWTRTLVVQDQLKPGLAELPTATIWTLVSLTPDYRTKPKAKWGTLGALLFSVMVVLVPWNRRKRFVNDPFSVR